MADMETYYNSIESTPEFSTNGMKIQIEGVKHQNIDFSQFNQNNQAILIKEKKQKCFHTLDNKITNTDE